MSVILAISFAFAVITLSVSGSMIKTNDVFRKTTYGEWQLILPGINSKLKGAAANSDWLDELGVMNVYGTIGEDGIGTVDETLKKLGHITVNEGRFPESDGEIAMEADLLSKLGIDYTPWTGCHALRQHCGAGKLRIGNVAPRQRCRNVSACRHY